MELATKDFYTPIKEAIGLERDITHDGVLVLVDYNQHIRGMYDGMAPANVPRIISGTISLIVKCHR